jgi:hypothetical protein
MVPPSFIPLIKLLAINYLRFGGGTFDFQIQPYVSSNGLLLVLFLQSVAWRRVSHLVVYSIRLADQPSGGVMLCPHLAVSSK